jgi:hypothetical protein
VTDSSQPQTGAELDADPTDDAMRDPWDDAAVDGELVVDPAELDALPEPDGAGELDDPAAELRPLRDGDGRVDRPDEEDALGTDELLPEPEDSGWDPPDHPSTPTAEGVTADSAETLDDRLRQEEPEPDPYADPGTDAEV